jgi:L-fucose isomerase-like protein
MKRCIQRFLAGQPPAFTQRPKARLQPLLAKKGVPNIDVAKLARMVADIAIIEPTIAIESPQHWQQVVSGLGTHIDAILPVSIPAYPTEVWNSHPQPLVERGLPVVFWPLIDCDEPDFWRWSARDMLRALGADVHIVKNMAEGGMLLRALAMKRFLANTKMIVFGEQNFPWNAHAAGHLITRSLGCKITVNKLSDFRRLYSTFTDADVTALWECRKKRYLAAGVKDDQLQQALRTYLAIRQIMEREQAIGMGVNCFGDLITNGGRDVPCLAQMLLREDGFIAACDGDFCAMMSMALITYYMDQPCMMSNMYPVSYTGALKDHFGGDPLSPDRRKYPRKRWKNMARLAHCGYVGVISPEMTSRGKTPLTDWGGTWEIKRDGHGCGSAGDLCAGADITAVELCFDGKTLLLATGRVLETTRHKNMPHCQLSALLEFNGLEEFIENISREHTAIVYGHHIRELTILANVLGLTVKTF